MRFIFVILFLVLLPSLSYAEDDIEFPNIQEIPIIGLNDIAVSSFMNDGTPVIYYDPNIVNNTDRLVVSFFKVHEYAHHILRHVTAHMFETNPYKRVILDRKNEVDADRFATEFWSKKDPLVVGAAIAILRSPPTSNWGDLTHLPSKDRAELIENYYRQLRQGTNMNITGPDDKVTQNDIDECDSQCTDLENECDDLLDTASQCSDQCDDTICDICNNINVLSDDWDRCNNQCDSCTNTCDKNYEKVSDRCNKKTDDCIAHCQQLFDKMNSQKDN